MKKRLQELDGQFCPVCDEWIDIETEGNITCPNCLTQLVAELSDSDYEDWHLWEQRKVDEQAQGLFNRFWQGLKEIFVSRQWDGSASNYSSTDDYCKACLIDVNPSGEDKIQALCKLPVKKPGSSTIDPEGLQAAAGGNGITQVTKPSDVDQAKWDSAVKSAANTIISNYPKLLDKDAPASVYEIAGKEPPSTERAMSYSRINQKIWERLQPDMMGDSTYLENNAYPIDVYFDENGYYALCLVENQLSRYPLSVEGDELVFGELEPVMEVHQPVQTRTVITRQTDGRYRWFSVSGTSVLNRSGEIDSRELFDSFIAYAQKTGEYPIRQFYHSGEVYRTGQADYLARDEYCYITSGLYDDTPLGQAEIKARQNNPDYWGDSIGFMPTTEPELSPIANGINIPVYKQGINKEISTLPEREAAHLFTRTEVQRMSLDGKAREAFVKLFTDAGQTEEDALKWLEQNPQARNRAIEENGLITRNEETQEDNNQGKEFVIDDSVIEVIGRAVVETLGIETEKIEQLSTGLVDTKEGFALRDVEINKLRSTIDNLVQRLEKLEGKQQTQERQIEQDTPAKFNGKTRVVYRPREASDGDGKQSSYAEIAQSRLPKGAY